MKDAFAAALDAPVERAVLLAGGASKEAWAVDSDGRELLIRRAAGGVIHHATLSLAHEFEVLRAAHEAGVRVPEPDWVQLQATFPVRWFPVAAPLPSSTTLVMRMVGFSEPVFDGS